MTLEAPMLAQDCQSILLPTGLRMDPLPTSSPSPNHLLPPLRPEMPEPVKSYLSAQAGGREASWNPGLDLHTEGGRSGQNGCERCETLEQLPNPRVCPGMPLWNAPLPPIALPPAIHTLKLTDVCGGGRAPGA